MSEKTSFLDKMKGSLNKVSDKLATSSLELTKLIKEIKDFGKYNERFSLENQKYIEYLKNAEHFETGPFSDTLENIEASRKELVESLNTDCIVPLEELVEDWLELQDMKKDVEKTIKDHEKDKKSLERGKAKLEKLENAEERVEEKIAAQEEVVNEGARLVGESFDLVKNKEAALEKVDAKYKTKEKKVLKEVLKKHKDLLLKFHQHSIDILSSTAAKPTPKKAAKKTTKKSTKKSTKSK
ncbi:hypothetical protein DSAG12_01423 [Promethearchaeum syntrophicum]|uniref:Chromosome partition protein Smc n=1 Tax=Promethearchaeum syntrophicum TaxID=2594042 RepID=A0A5B9D9T8_9ARCH|nr:hypothetical protein [Candidatus Prometheoarchaeum syntrophicum]QEE15597.1 hypothetical protein DSAG12_01423 [Candidatus Prometheoarchaeum syntrophicum]